MDDGTTQTANLFGLDLLASDDGATTLTMLPDGLGSVQVEMLDGVVSSVTTYEPYGSILMQVGTKGTTYGFTGEQEDAATNLLDLRARYYSPHLKIFLSKDPYPGSIGKPATQNGYNYSNANPVNYTDPSGLCAEVGDESCWNMYEEILRLAPGIDKVNLEEYHGLYLYNNSWVELHELPWRTLRNIRNVLNGSDPLAYDLEQLKFVHDLGLLVGQGIKSGIVVANIPVAETYVDVTEAVSGQDYITGEPLSSFEQGVAVAAVLIPAVSAQEFRACSYIFENATDIGRKIRHYGTYFRQFDQGQGFSSAIDLDSGISILLPSTREISRFNSELRNGVEWVAQYGGHGDVSDRLVELGAKQDNIRGYVTRWTGDRLEIFNWRSGTLTVRLSEMKCHHTFDLKL